jgi:O-antigen/teichoic acid export membrane protein
LVLGNVASFNEALMLRRYRFISVSKNNFFAFLIGNFITPIVLSKYYGLEYLALIIGYFVFELLRVLLMENSIKLQEVFSQKTNAQSGLRKFAVGFTVAKLGNHLALNSDNIIIGSIMGASSLGLYSRAYQLVLAPVNLIYGVLDKIYFSVISREQENLTSVKRVYLESASVIFLLTFPPVIGLSMFSEEIILLVFNTAWSEIYIVFGVMILTVPFRLAYRLNDSVLRALGKVNRRAFIQWVYAGLVIGAAYYFAFINLQAVSVAISAVVILNYLMLTVLMCSVLSISLVELLYWSFIPCLFLCSVLITVTFLIYWLSFGFEGKDIVLWLAIFGVSSINVIFSCRPAIIILRKLLFRLQGSKEY